MGRSRSRWGWHRLSPEWAARLVADAELPPRALALDIGAGDGVITAALLEAGAEVVAIELHPERAARLRRRFGRAVVVARADAADLRLPRRPFHVVANPPFSVSAPLLRRLLAGGSRMLTADLVLQGQVVARWTGPRAPGSERWSRRYTARRGRPIPRRAFHPRPHVDARVLHIRRR